MADHEFHRPLDLKKDILSKPNLVPSMDARDVAYIGSCVKEGYLQDVESRQDWERRNAEALKLALQVMEAKSFPWVGCSNIKFPLITVAALQYQARAYPDLISGDDLVKCKVYGDDPDGQKTAKAERIARHMSWQNLEQDDDWEEEHDKALLVQAIAGCAFIKRVFDPVLGYQDADLVLPKNFVINYFTREIDDAQRYTHTFELSENDVRQREIDGRYAKPDTSRSGTYEPSYIGSDKTDADLPKEQNSERGPLVDEQNRRQGMQPPQVDRATPYFTGEQYCWFDLDGDGYDEPYIVTFDINTGLVRRIVARFLPSGIKRFNDKIYSIDPIEFFVKIPFWPSPDGGFYDLGLGALVGPINEAVNTSFNQMIDAGTMATLGGGFVGRGFKSRGGPFTFRAGMWHTVDASGDDLRKAILPLPVKEPSSVLFQLMAFLVQYAERIVSTTEIQLGENPGQNTPAETTRTLNENGSRIYNAIFKRTWRSLRDEFRIQYDFNQYYFTEDSAYSSLTSGQFPMVRADDYLGDSTYVRPAADPNVVSDTMRLQRATAVMQASMQFPGFNRYQSGLEWLKAMRASNIEKVYPRPMQQGPNGQPVPAADFPPPQDPKMLDIQVKQQKLQLDSLKQQADQKIAAMRLIDEVQESRAKVQNLLAQAALYTAQSKTEMTEPIIKLLYAEIESERSRGDRFLQMIDLLMQGTQSKDGNSDGTGPNGGAGMAGMEAQPSNAAILGTLAPIRPNGAGGLVGGPVSFQ